ncbi:hypothetical protein [Streptomyces sp. NPDC127112]|uniref:hypothetical protein n=1 Tax=Streptomyces sp. NPDC127112 TaxID=3345364 RepID=UPI00363F525A
MPSRSSKKRRLVFAFGVGGAAQQPEFERHDEQAHADEAEHGRVHEYGYEHDEGQSSGGDGRAVSGGTGGAQRVGTGR